MDFKEIPVGDEQETLSSFADYFTNKPVQVYVYLNDLEMWCTLTPIEDMEEYLLQTIMAVPTTDPITVTGDGTEEIGIGEVFALDEEGAPNMVRVEYFEDPKPRIVLVVSGGCIVSAYSLTGDSNFAYAVIDLDNQELDGDGNETPVQADVYVVDGTPESVEQVIADL